MPYARPEISTPDCRDARRARGVRRLLFTAIALWASCSTACAVVSHAGSAPVGVGSPARPLPEAWRSGPVRAVWIVRDALVDEQHAREAVREAAAAGFDAAFVQIVGRADALYRSDVLPRAEFAYDARSYDPLAAVLDEAESQGIEIHAWINVYLVWSSPAAPRSHRHVVALHPDWTVAGPDLKPYAHLSQSSIARRGAEGVYLSPAHLEARAYVRRAVREILERYEVDGIHLDYVRYPTPDAGYDAASRQGFATRTGTDAAELVRNAEGLAIRLGEERLSALRAEWRDWRADQVTALVREICSDVRAIRPAALLSAAVRPDPDEARDGYGQDWALWLDEGILDVAAPMCYMKGTGDFARQARKICDHVDAGRVLAGVAVYNQGARAAVEKIAAADACGMLGTSVFSWNAMAEDGRYVAAIASAQAGGGRLARAPVGAGGAEMGGR